MKSLVRKFSCARIHHHQQCVFWTERLGKRSCSAPKPSAVRSWGWCKLHHAVHWRRKTKAGVVQPWSVILGRKEGDWCWKTWKWLVTRKMGCRYVQDRPMGCGYLQGEPYFIFKGDRLKAKYRTIKRLRYTCRFLILNTTGTKEQGTLRKTFAPIPQLERSECRELYPTTVIILIVINTIKVMTVVGVLRHDCPRWAVASFQACCSYSKWRPRQRLSTERTEGWKWSI